MGFILFCMAFFIIYIVSSLCSDIFNALKMVGTVIVIGFENKYKQRQMDKNLQGQLKIKRQKEIEQQININKRISEEGKKNFQLERQLAFGILNKVNELKFKYPYAEQNLFDRYKNEFNDLTITELDYMEKLILESHIKNIKSNTNMIPNYTYADVEKLNPLEVKDEYPLRMKLYRINVDYVLVIENIVISSLVMYQSKNYMPILELCNGVLNEIYKLKNLKQSVQAINVDGIIEQNKIEEIHKIREQEFIDRIKNGIKKTKGE